jgi:hypothetical protein
VRVEYFNAADSGLTASASSALFGSIIVSVSPYNAAS